MTLPSVIVAAPDNVRSHAIGVDLAWGGRSQTGLAHLVGPAGGKGAWRLSETATIVPLDGIVAWITSRVPREAPCQVGVDAPVVATNPVGTTRAADRELASRFAPFKVACYPADVENAQRGIALVAALGTHGFRFAPPGSVEARRAVFETFPTAAQLGLFDLRRPVRYKHGPVEVRQERLRDLQMKLARYEDAAVPLEWTSALKTVLQTDPARFRGAQLKALEDRLDALLCAIVAALAWTAPQRLVTYGTLEAGTITVPYPPLAPGQVL